MTDLILPSLEEIFYPDEATPNEEELRIFREIYRNLGSRVGLTPLHWILINRAIFYYVQGLNTADPDPNLDRMLVQLLQEPLRSLRSEASLLEALRENLLDPIFDNLPPDVKLSLARNLKR
jgi:hypothetical protein